ncbi:transposase [Enorma phocaeensis]|uniref:Transposase n=1 Tax=Enorma phocaeensis TaxID=1871019 RepID=A0ABT7VAK8_9ACTN|nr:transposase [Enorma phocaeensis]MDM8275532.1 transposase [Enorma phocaeensis]
MRTGGSTGPTCSRSDCATCSRPAPPSGTESSSSRCASVCRTRIDKVKKLSKKVKRHKEAIVRAVGLGISNARVEAINNKIKLTVRMGYGFQNINSLMMLVMRRCTNLPLALP